MTLTRPATSSGFADALRAEWTKARTVAITGWLLVATAALGIGLSAAITAVVHYQPDAYQDPTKLALSGIELAQALVAILAVLVVTGEYRTGMIRTSLTAIPCRSNLLAAKATVVTALTLAAGTITVVASLLLGRLLLRANGFNAAHGYPLPSLGASPPLRAAIGSVLYLGLIGLLATGTALAVRDSAAAVGIALGLLYLFPIAAQLVSDPSWQRHLQQVGPMTAGLTIQATTKLHALPISPWAGLAVLGAWATAALLAGGLRLRLSDA